MVDPATVSLGQEDWLRRIRAEYLEIPGLNLTERQAQRLWGLEAQESQRLLNSLVEAHFLRRTEAKLYVRADAWV
jgi:hypothetical protein